MFDLREFINDTITSMMGNEPEYKVRQYASGWYEKGVLGDTDLQEVQTFYTSQNEEQIMTTEEPVLEDAIPMEEVAK